MFGTASLRNAAHLFYFDSGVGGLSGVRAIRERGVRAKITYIGDSAHVPYGKKTEQQLDSYGRKGMEHAAMLGVDLVVPVCHNWDRKARNYTGLLSSKSAYIPLIETGAKGIVAEPNSHVVAAVSSNNMTDSREYSKAIQKLAPERRVIEVHGHRLPSFVEEMADGTADRFRLRAEVQKVLSVVPNDTDLLVHACTHFPFLDHEFSEVLPEIKRVSSVDYQAHEVEKALGDKARIGNNETIFLTTGNATQFARQVSNLLKIDNPHVQHINDYGFETLPHIKKMIA